MGRSYYRRSTDELDSGLVAVTIYLLLFLAVQLGFAITSAPNGDKIVYTTRTGECYHKENCSTVGVGYKRTLADAVKHGFRSCGRCNPPQLKTGERGALEILDLPGFAFCIFGLTLLGYYLTWVASFIFSLFSVELVFLPIRQYVALSAIWIMFLYAFGA